jgi:hypothetical protein
VTTSTLEEYKDTLQSIMKWKARCFINTAFLFPLFCFIALYGLNNFWSVPIGLTGAILVSVLGVVLHNHAEDTIRQKQGLELEEQFAVTVAKEIPIIMTLSWLLVIVGAMILLAKWNGWLETHNAAVPGFQLIIFGGLSYISSFSIRACLSKYYGMPHILVIAGQSILLFLALWGSVFGLTFLEEKGHMGNYWVKAILPTVCVALLVGIWAKRVFDENNQ